MDWKAPRTCSPNYLYTYSKLIVYVIAIVAIGLAAASLYERIQNFCHPQAEVMTDIHVLQRQVLKIKNILEEISPQSSTTYEKSQEEQPTGSDNEGG